MATVPEHLHEINAREAFAPYNFIPLPEKAVPAEVVLEQQRVVIKAEHQPKEAQYLVRHDQYFADRHTGTITCTLRTETPLYVRCGLNARQFKDSIQEVEQQQQSNEARTAPTKNKPDFFASPGQRAVIPGSSLRGLMRSLVEIVSHSKIDLVTRKYLFFRSVDTTNLGMHYRQRMTNQVRAGFLRLQADNSRVIEETEFYKLPIAVLEKHIWQRYTNYRSTKLPNERYQYTTIWVLPLNKYKIKEVSLSQPQGNDWLPATLVITGNVPGKKHEYVLIQQRPQQVFRLENEQLQRFHDEDQLSQWQTQAFPQRDKLRKRKGELLDDQPIFFIVDPANPQKVSFFGRAGMFRLPYTNSPYDLIPPHLRVGSDDAPIDLAEAMFGFVHQEVNVEPNQITSYASRLRFSDAKLVNQQLPDAELWDTEITPPILASPKPTTFQHYLTQDATDRQSLRHYGDDRNDTTIRGYKQYWHHGRFAAQDRHKPDANADSTQTTRMRPVKSGVEFQFQIGFENLSDVELGALIYVLELAASPNHRLKLGMGKPFGFGSIAINYHIATTNRQAHYSQLFNQGQNTWLRAERDWIDQDLLAKQQAFCTYILQHSGEQERGFSEFNHIPRIQQLLAMLEWDVARFEQTEPRSWAELVRYMEIERKEDGRKRNEYRDRPVLPTPLRVIKRTPIKPKKPEKPLKVNQTVSGTIVGRVNRQVWDVRLDNKKLVYAKIIGNSINPQHLNNGKRVDVRIVSLEDDAVQEIRKIQ
ncbi:MAG: TIGR03986 family CRISPR-associated RAMP protein [Chloroflexi bacterium]|nr:TIGR03986 family CRISPR-associated RAMP protein [Chloroflexota bacterium]